MVRTVIRVTLVGSVEEEFLHFATTGLGTLGLAESFRLGSVRGALAGTRALKDLYVYHNSKNRDSLNLLGLVDQEWIGEKATPIQSSKRQPKRTRVVTDCFEESTGP